MAGAIFSATVEAALYDVYGARYKRLQRSDKVLVNFLVWRHLFRLMSYSDLLVGLRKFELAEGAIKLRKQLTSDGRVFALKLALYYIHKNAIKVPREIRATMREFGVKKEDHTAFNLLEQDIRLVKGLNGYVRSKFRAYTLAKWNKLVAAAVDESRDYAARYAMKKMRFIMQANGYDLHDLAGDLVEEGVRGMMDMYPCFECKLHAINVGKTAIHNVGQNKIQKYTTGKRNTLTKGKDGTFTSNKVSLDKLVTTRLGDAQEYEYADESGRTRFGYSKTELSSVEAQVSASMLVKSASAKYQKLLGLLTGEPNAEFTAYLHSERLIRKRETNEDLMDKCVEEGRYLQYKNPAMDYLGIDRKEGRSFLKKFKTELQATKG